MCVSVWMCDCVFVRVCVTVDRTKRNIRRRNTLKKANEKAVSSLVIYQKCWHGAGPQMLICRVAVRPEQEQAWSHAGDIRDTRIA